MRCRECVWRECELRVLVGVLCGGVSVACVVSFVAVGCLLGYVWRVMGGFSGWGLVERIRCDL